MNFADCIPKTPRLALTSTLLVALQFLSPQVYAAGSNPNGQQLYMIHCSGCHGAFGISVVPDAKNFSRFDLITQPDQSLLELIRSGRNMMPGYMGILNDQEITSIINHIRTLN